MEQARPDSMKTAFTYGLIAGIALCLFNVCLYLGGVQYFLSAISMIGYVIITVIAVMAGRRQKKINGGYIETPDAVKVIFLVFALGFLLQTFFNYVLLNYIDTPFRDALAKASAEKAAELIKKWGGSQSQVDEVVQNALDKDNYRLSSQLLGYGVMCIISFIVSLIIALIIRKKPSPFDNSFNQ